MSKILGLVFNRWVFGILGLIALSLLIWVAGPLVAFADYRPLESETARYVLIGLVVFFVVARLVWRFAKAKWANARLMDGLAKQPSPQSSPAPDVSAEEVAELQKRFQEAINVLKQASRNKPGLRALFPGRQYLYDLPWYIFVGASGSGKTTALIHSGLNFPLAERLGQPKVRGIGGTRNCDWWFTDEAVLIDTAGRYTTQESNEEVDKGAWDGFLRLLKKYRPRRPINGAIVTISAADLLQQNAAELERHAAALRTRIQDLHTQLGVRFPVYVLVTKGDLLPGFMEFFSEYGREERAQVWGVTFPLDEKGGNPLPRLDDELATLEARLNQRLVDRLQQERDPQKRALIYAFPQQFSTLREVLGGFLASVLEPSPQYEIQPMVRGVYFTSGTQEGSPIDRMMRQLARAFHLEHRLLPPNRPSGKAYFITRLLRNVVFAEAGLAGANLRLERRRAALEWGALVLAGIVTIGSILAWAVSYSRNKSYVANVDAQVKVVSDQVKALPVRPTSDVVGLLPTLQAVRGLAIDATAVSIPTSMTFGLYQGDKLAAASNAAYRRLLRDAFLPRLQLRLEESLRAAGRGNPEVLYESLKTYIMLSDPQHFDAGALKTSIAADWAATLPREVTVDQRKELALHLDALLSQGAMISPIVPDAQLIAGARETIARTSLAQRIYNRLRRQDLGAKLPEFTIVKAAGPAAHQVFARTSGESLTKGVPGIFSYDGYYKIFAPAAEEATKQMSSDEGWVIGVAAKDRPSITDVTGTGRLNDDVKRLFLEEYANTWERFVNDIAVVHTDNLQDTIGVVQILSATDSPLISLSQAIVKEVTLTKIAEAEKDSLGKVFEKAKKAGEDTVKALRDKTGQPERPAASRPLETIVDDRFDGLRRYVRSQVPGKPAPIDSAVAMLADLYSLLNANKSALTSKTALPTSDLPTKIKAEAARVPEPIRSLLAAATKDGVSNTVKEAGSTLGKDINRGIGIACLDAIGERYPFVKTSPRNVTPDDFGRVFATGGLLDDFFQKNLLPWVDTSTRPWKFRDLGGATMGTSSINLLPFERAQKIREVFFPAGGRAPALKLEFKPLEMDAGILQFVLDIDGQVIKYSHGPQVVTAIQWPGPRGSMQVRLQLSPSRAGGSGQVFEGPWALFRMLDGAQIEPTAQPEKFRVIFNTDGRPAQFEVVTNSVQNPFRLSELEQFRCPERL